MATGFWGVETWNGRRGDLRRSDLLAMITSSTLLDEHGTVQTGVPEGVI
jgi:hypothetical protein